MNIAELLKDCPSGMELDCTSYDNVSFDKISDDKKAAYPIFCYITDKEGNHSGISFTENGCESKRYGAKCVIFPKGKTTWEGFVPPYKFKDGDVLTYMFCNKPTIYIYREKGCCNTSYYAGYSSENEQFYKGEIGGLSGDRTDLRLATEEEKQKLFQVIKDNGYKWNAETKTLEKFSRFKIGDKIKKKGLNTTKYLEITDITPNIYIFRDGSFQYFKIIDKDYELIPNKFDITTLVPFESRVLVRSVDNGLWKPAIYGFSHQNGYYVVGGACWKQCIPYKGNEYLCGTTNACNNFYKTWEE